MNSLPPLSYRHLVRLQGPHGLFEHAEGTVPRQEHGYCTDDNARLLALTSRRPDLDDADELSRVALQFVVAAIAPDGRCANRRDSSGAWIDTPTTDDCWGRALYGLGTCAARHPDATMRATALAAFSTASELSARSPRTMAFAALGAVEVAQVDDRHIGAQRLMRQTVSTIGPVSNGAWQWPEPRLAYANATLAEALIAAGTATQSTWDVDRGLRMLGWLLDRDTRDGHLSVTPAGGAGPDDRGPGFDQQPIEVAALADACTRAHAATGDARWADAVQMAARWFMGDNDAATMMYDPQSGGGFDGLHADSVNLNQGAESTIAFITTIERALALVHAE
ncbi:MAG TPA: glycosyltransferase [Acidimicrobiaceae bacterium]|nr:glycosyltransferase [Acidimicrobiaceae bacterium]